MGVDVCYTNHAEADQDDMDDLMTLLAVAGVNFLISVPGSDDVMLSYQTLSYHDVLGLRHLLRLRPAPEFDAWLERMGMYDPQARLAPPSLGGEPMRRLLGA
jgi:ethanolamine ammonia-lyase large subunit